MIMKEIISTGIFLILALLGTSANAQFTCPTQGLFADPASSDCTSFYSCNSKLNAQFVRCPDRTYFSPELQGCFSNYDCATKSIPYTTNPCKGFNYESIPDKSSLDCSQYLGCHWSDIYNAGENIKFSVAQSSECPPGIAFAPITGCDSNNNCSHYDCTEAGQFADTSQNDCSTFIRCNEFKNRYNYDGVGGGQLLFPEVKSCPEGTKFNPFLQKCDSFYKCNGVDKHHGKDPCSTYNWASPFVKNPLDESAKTYIYCEYDDYNVKSGIILKGKCPKNTFFSPVLGLCYDNYDPMEMCTKDACSSGPGRYVNYDSGKCDTYIECRSDVDTAGLYAASYEIRHCPKGTNFNPKTRLCSKQYVCPTFPANYCYAAIPTSTPTPTTRYTTTAAPYYW